MQPIGNLLRGQMIRTTAFWRECNEKERWYATFSGWMLSRFFFRWFFFFYSFKFKQKYNKWQRGIFKAAQCLRGSFTWADTPNQSLASCFPLFPFPVLWYAKLTGCSWCLHSEQIHTRVPSILSSQHQQGSKWALYPKCWTIPLNDFASVESFPKLKKFNSSQKLH